MCDLNGCGKHRDMPPIVVPDEHRRLFLKGLVALPLAAVLFDPRLARAQAERVQTVSITTEDGREISGALAMPAQTPAPAVLLIHEWWGLNDQIKAVAAELARQGYIALAVDLYGGEVATTPEEARALTQSVQPEQATDTLVSWIDWLKDHEKSTGRVATLGWCFGGAWSLNASLATPVDATVIYYGRVPQSAEELESLQSPVLGHFGTEDESINEEMVQGFERAMEQAGKRDQLTVYWYEADHAFANPTGARYDAEDASLAWQRTLDFLEQHLKRES
jgi:carboxymethylenebutenolidase